MKTKEELNALKEEVATLNAKLSELSEDELAEVVGGAVVFNKSFTKSITLISASIFGKSVNENEVLRAKKNVKSPGSSEIVLFDEEDETQM